MEELQIAGWRPGSEHFAADRFANTTVLLVEDAPASILLTSEMLADLGVALRVATDGKKALELLVRHGNEIGLVLMDIQLPVMDGLTATRAIRSRPQWRHLPIVAISSHQSAADRAACLQSGMNEVLVKPVARAVMQEVLQRYLPSPAEGGSDVVI